LQEHPQNKDEVLWNEKKLKGEIKMCGRGYYLICLILCSAGTINSALYLAKEGFSGLWLFCLIGSSLGVLAAIGWFITHLEIRWKD
jgi:hypothetical protein